MQEKSHVERMVDRLKNEMERQRLSPMELSRRAQVGRSFIYDMLNGKACNPTTNKIRAVANALEVSVPYLTEGNCEEKDLRGRAEYVAIEVLSNATSVEKCEIFSDKYYLPKDFFAFAGIDLRELCVYFMRSDEMEPTIHRQEILLIDRKAPTSFSAGIYAIKDEHNISIRRLERFYSHRQANFYVHPDNRNYRSYNVSERDICVIGKVVRRFGAL
ncbi:MAG: LexA family transcriptional regulator [Rickettsiales bacterium]